VGVSTLGVSRQGPLDSLQAVSNRLLRLGPNLWLSARTIFHF
jgi:hypothetical protein